MSNRISLALPPLDMRFELLDAAKSEVYKSIKSIVTFQSDMELSAREINHFHGFGARR